MTSLNFNSGLFSHVVSLRDASYDILSFTLSIFFDHPIFPIILLSWTFYNSKSSILNWSASLFGRKLCYQSQVIYQDGSRKIPPSSLPSSEPPSIDPMEDMLVRDLGPIRGPHSGSTSLALSCNPTPGPNLVPTLIPAPVLTPTPAPVITDELFIKFIIETNQGLRQPPAEREQTLKAKVLEVYYSKLNMDCYYYCQQCKDYFKTAGATRFNLTLFEAFFLHRNISVHWVQFKCCNQGEELTPII